MRTERYWYSLIKTSQSKELSKREERNLFPIDYLLNYFLYPLYIPLIPKFLPYRSIFEENKGRNVLKIELPWPELFLFRYMRPSKGYLLPICFLKVLEVWINSVAIWAPLSCEDYNNWFLAVFYNLLEISFGKLNHFWSA